MTAQEIIIRPIVTEKSNFALAEGKYTFEVHKDATKTEVKKAVEQLFNVKVISVNTVSMPGKEKRMGVHSGKTPDWKKAIVKIDTNPQEEVYFEKGGKQVTTNKKYNSEIADFNTAV
jgi:large subunit ribosomal protein L23